MLIAKTAFQKISQKTGRKPTACKCKVCKSQCEASPCLGTPEDIEKIIDAGFGSRIFNTVWAAGLVMGVTNDIIEMYQPEFDKQKAACAFFQDGLCQLHNLGLKPTEGKLSHHSITDENINPHKSLSFNVAKEWLNPQNSEIVERIKQKLNQRLS